MSVIILLRQPASSICRPPISILRESSFSYDGDREGLRNTDSDTEVTQLVTQEEFITLSHHSKIQVTLHYSVEWIKLKSTLPCPCQSPGQGNISKYKQESSLKFGNFFCHTKMSLDSLNFNVTHFYCQAKSNDYVQVFRLFLRNYLWGLSNQTLTFVYDWCQQLVHQT
jgi:hypothetical protein